MATATAALLVAAGCGGSADGDSSAKTAPEALPTPTPPPAAPGALNEIREDFALNFSAVSWYTPPDTLEIEGTTLVARTDFYPDGEGRDLGTQLCNALNGNYVLANTAEYGLDGVTVYAGDAPVASAAGGGTC